MINNLLRCAFLSLLLSIPLSAQAGLSALYSKLVGHESPARLTILLVDLTGSITAADKTLYSEAAKRLIATEMNGDRIVLGDISGMPISSFHLQSDEIIPAKTGRRFDDERSLKASKDRINAAFEKLLPIPALGNGTYILDTLCATRPLVEEAQKKGMLVRYVLLSDAVENSPDISLSSPNDPITVKRAIQKRKTLIPDLTGVEVFFIGAGGGDAARYAAIEKFWGDLVTSHSGTVTHYGRTIPSFIK